MYLKKKTKTKQNKMGGGSHQYFILSSFKTGLENDNTMNLTISYFTFFPFLSFPFFSVIDIIRRCKAENQCGINKDNEYYANCNSAKGDCKFFNIKGERHSKPKI